MTICAGTLGRATGGNIDSWNWVGTKYEIGPQMLIFKAGINFGPGTSLQSPENQVHDGIESHKESILWNWWLGSLKVKKFGLRARFRLTPKVTTSTIKNIVMHITFIIHLCDTKIKILSRPFGLDIRCIYFYSFWFIMGHVLGYFEGASTFWPLELSLKMPHYVACPQKY